MKKARGSPPLMPIVFESRIATLVTFGADGRLAPAWPDFIRAELVAEVAIAAIVEPFHHPDGEGRRQEWRPAGRNDDATGGSYGGEGEVKQE